MMSPSVVSSDLVRTVCSMTMFPDPVMTDSSGITYSVSGTAAESSMPAAAMKASSFPATGTEVSSLPAEAMYASSLSAAAMYTSSLPAACTGVPLSADGTAPSPPIIPAERSSSGTMVSLPSDRSEMTAGTSSCGEVSAFAPASVFPVSDVPESMSSESGAFGSMISVPVFPESMSPGSGLPMSGITVSGIGVFVFPASEVPEGTGIHDPWPLFCSLLFR